MKKILTLFAVAAALMTVSCSKENQAPEAQDGKTIQLTLQATRGEADTKTAITMNEEYHSLESVWAAGDKIYVYSIKSGAKLGFLTVDAESIVDQKASATSQYSTSYAAFIGSIELGGGDAIGDTFAFVYQGNRAELSVSEGILTFPIGTSDSVAGLNEWDVAYATGKIQGTEGSASCAVTFTNKVAFGYFTTTPLGSGSDIDMNYFSDFTLNVKTGAFAGVKGTVTVPRNAAFFMPLVPGTVNMTADTEWDDTPGYLRYRGIQQSISFTATAGYYYRLGISGEYGPVQIESTDWTNYEILRNSTFAISASQSVHFTQGNLQWISTDPSEATIGYWKIADTQYSYFGNNNTKGTSTAAGSTVGAGNLDIFGWGEVQAPFRCSNTDSEYSLSNDWAYKFNNGTPLYVVYDEVVWPNHGETYYVLTAAQWDYLLNHQYWGLATVTVNNNSVKGLVVCPSTINTLEAAKGILGNDSIVRSSTDVTPSYSDIIINNQEIIDNNGLLFLPAAGYRSDATSFGGVGYEGRYWTPSSASTTNAYNLYFENGKFYTNISFAKHRSFSVRLATLVGAE